MKIKLRVSYATATMSAGPNDEIDVDDETAIRLIKKGYAAPLSGVPVETAVKVPEETRVLHVPAPVEKAEAPEERPAQPRSKGKKKKGRR